MELDSGCYAPSVHPHTPDPYQPESVRSAPTHSSEVGHFRLPQMGHFRLPLTDALVTSRRALSLWNKECLNTVPGRGRRLSIAFRHRSENRPFG